MECNSCRMCKSADKRLEKFVASKEFDTAFHRTETQKQKCGFGLQGVCCRLCSNGPCRVTPKSPKGICGADADTIVISPPRPQRGSDQTAASLNGVLLFIKAK